MIVDPAISKDRYIKICEKVALPIHFQHWWLDCVCGPDNWEVCLSLNNDGGFQGCFVYYKHHKWGIQFIKTPPLTSYTGLWINYPHNIKKQASKYTFEKKVIEELIAQIPTIHFFAQHFYPSVENSLPFQWAGFEVSIRYTYQLKQISDLESIYKSFKGSIRTSIKAAEQYLYLAKAPTFDDFLTLHKENASFKPIPYPMAVFRDLYNSLLAKKQGQLLAVQNQEGLICAALLLTWDTQSAYFLSGVRSLTHSSKDAMCLLIWKAIQIAAQKVEQFDFEGSSNPSIEHFFRAFGGQRLPVLKISKTSNLLFHMISKWRGLPYA